MEKKYRDKCAELDSKNEQLAEAYENCQQVLNDMDTATQGQRKSQELLEKYE